RDRRAGALHRRARGFARVAVSRPRVRHGGLRAHARARARSLCRRTGIAPHRAPRASRRAAPAVLPLYRRLSSSLLSERCAARTPAHRPRAVDRRRLVPGIRLMNDPLIGSVLANTYRITRVIGEGGMARLYEAEHLRLDARVAIKLMHDDLARDPAQLARFQREAR